MANFIQSKPTVENYLYATSFKFVATRIPGVTYNCQSVNVPGVTVGEMTQNNPRSGRTLKIPSQNLAFDDLTLKFIIDETITNWLEIYNWMQALRVVDDWETVKPFNKLNQESQISDAYMSVFNSANNLVRTFKYHNIFPKQLTAIEFDSGASGTEALSATVTFAFEYFTVETA